jgi:hypothetical protein
MRLQQLTLVEHCSWMTGTRRIVLVLVGNEWEASNVGDSFARVGPPVGGWPRFLAALDALGIDAPPPDVAIDADDGARYELTIEVDGETIIRTYENPNFGDLPEEKRATQIVSLFGRHFRA